MALAIDSQEASNAGHRSTGANLTWSFTNTAGNKLIVGVVVTSGSAAQSVSGVTYGGVSMTAGPSVAWDTSQSLAQLFYLDSPATGANSVVVSSTTTPSAFLGGAISFSGAATGALGTGSSATDGGTLSAHAQAGSWTPASGNYALGVGGWGAGVAATADAGQTATFKLVGSGNTGGDDICCVYEQSSGSAINPGFTWSGADHWGIVAAEVKAASSAAASIPALTMAPMVAS